jgi:hypothetical protein
MHIRIERGAASRNARPTDGRNAPFRSLQAQEHAGSKAYEDRRDHGQYHRAHDRGETVTHEVPHARVTNIPAHVAILPTTPLRVCALTKGQCAPGGVTRQARRML